MRPADSFKRNVPILALCQALFMSGSSLLVATSALVGFALAEDKTYASAGFTAQLLSTMLASIPAAFLMSRIGRKPAFLVGTLIAASGAVICSYAILQQWFFLFIAGSILLGTSNGFANYYRFAAADNVDQAHKSRAISYVLAGGVLAAIIGPNLANLTRDVISNAAFAGSYASLVGLYMLSFILLNLLDLPLPAPEPGSKPDSGRPLGVIARQPRFIIAVISGMLGYACMTLIMTATPLAMQQHAHPFSDTSFVIQWHVLGMFAPSFVTGALIRRLGLIPVMLSGAVFGLVCVAINLLGTSISHFWLALLLLGLSWNFLFIGATTLLTETYTPDERFKAQALNDFLVFSVVSLASLSAGAVHHLAGWRMVNEIAVPMFAVILLSLAWLSHIRPEVAIPDAAP